MQHRHHQDQRRAKETLMPGWRIIENRARAKRLIQYPKRYTLAVRQALTKLHLRWWEQVEVWNADYKFKLGAQDIAGGNQFIDFLVYAKGTQRRAMAILIENKASLVTPAEKNRWAAKQALLVSQAIPLILVKSSLGQQDIEALITIQLMKLRRKS